MIAQESAARYVVTCARGLADCAPDSELFRASLAVLLRAVEALREAEA